MALMVPSMPRLETLHWEDDHDILSTQFFTALALSNVKNFSVRHGLVDEEFILPLSDGHHWPLRNLDIELRWDDRSDHGQKGTLLPLTLSILRCCSWTLETLKLKTFCNEDFPYFFNSRAEKSVFPSLRRLTIDTVLILDSSMLNALIGLDTRVRELELKIDQSNEATNAFSMERGNIRSLETFISQNLHSKDFLVANPQLSKISIAEALPESLLQDKILPILKHCFHHLSSLSLAWGEATISDYALEQSNLHGLCQLQLSATRGEEG